MADLTKILNGPWQPPVNRQPDPPEVQLRDAIEDAGLRPPAQIIMDGRLHRFESGTKGRPGHNKPGWYVAFADGVPAGKFGCWRSDIEIAWRADVGREMSIAEQMAHSKRMAEVAKARDEAKTKTQEVVADVAETIWAGLDAAPEWHPYLQRKGVKAHGARVTGDGRLALPMYDPAGKLVSLQYIDGEGGKLYHASGRAGDAQWIVGDVDAPGAVYIAEGFATAATIAEDTGQPCAIAFSASNLPNVTKALREQRGNLAEIVVVADNDKGGIGFKYADQAAAKYGARVVRVPIEGMDANDYKAAGHDLMALLRPQVDSGWLIPADDFSKQPAPIAWMVKRWLQSDALIMVHGPSGGGKTFVVLEWAMHIAASLPAWNGFKVKPGAIVYLAGEGHHGLRARVAVWKQDKGVEHLDMWISREGCDLNTPEGYNRVVEAIRALGVEPVMIIVDTLHRFLMGDENSAQDAKTMLDACAGLMREFACSVLLVHHTGVSDEAQHRARGSSAWRGALDIEISVVPGKDGQPLQIVSRKTKDAEPPETVYCELRQLEIDGWVDEDGEPVTSCVIEIVDAPTKRPPPNPHNDSLKILESAFFDSGAQREEFYPGGKPVPYITNSAMRDYLEVKRNWGSRKIENAMDATSPTSLLGGLMNAEQIAPYKDGFVVLADDQTSAWLTA
jgi:phage/plasmid primase-like uncharacterized protein/KaiC/GvpD/RAD55 family RecA-like ATPase